MSLDYQERSSADDTKQTAKTKTDVYTQAAVYVADLLDISQLRGAFTLEEADGLVNTVKTLRDLNEAEERPLQTETHLKQSWTLAFDKLNLSQERGKLTLKEAWSLYNALQIYEKANVDASEST
jgi:hypothetical protein